MSIRQTSKSNERPGAEGERWVILNAIFPIALLALLLIAWQSWKLKLGA